MTTTCTTCGLSADADPERHSDRYAHWPTVRCATCLSNIPFGGEDRCDRCQTHDPRCRRCNSAIDERFAVNKCRSCGQLTEHPRMGTDGGPMSSRYQGGSGKRISSMTHARRGHPCSFCDEVPYGNGGQVAHGRKHVRRGEAVEIVKHYGTYPPTSNRMFLSVDDERVERYLSEGYERVES